MSIGRKRKGVFIPKRLNIPEHVVAQVDLLLYNRGAISYGAWSALVTDLLEKYLNDLKSSPDKRIEASNEPATRHPLED